MMSGGNKPTQNQHSDGNYTGQQNYNQQHSSNSGGFMGGLGGKLGSMMGGTHNQVSMTKCIVRASWYLHNTTVTI